MDWEQEYRELSEEIMFLRLNAMIEGHADFIQEPHRERLFRYFHEELVDEPSRTALQKKRLFLYFAESWLPICARSVRWDPAVHLDETGLAGNRIWSAEDAVQLLMTWENSPRLDKIHVLMRQDRPPESIMRYLSTRQTDPWLLPTLVLIGAISPLMMLEIARYDTKAPLFGTLAGRLHDCMKEFVNVLERYDRQRTELATAAFAKIGLSGPSLLEEIVMRLKPDLAVHLINTGDKKGWTSYSLSLICHLAGTVTWEELAPYRFVLYEPDQGPCFRPLSWSLPVWAKWPGASYGLCMAVAGLSRPADPFLPAHATLRKCRSMFQYILIRRDVSWNMGYRHTISRHMAVLFASIAPHFQDFENLQWSQRRCSFKNVNFIERRPQAVFPLVLHLPILYRSPMGFRMLHESGDATIEDLVNLVSKCGGTILGEEEVSDDVWERQDPGPGLVAFLSLYNSIFAALIKKEDSDRLAIDVLPSLTTSLSQRFDSATASKKFAAFFTACRTKTLRGAPEEWKNASPLERLGLLHDYIDDLAFLVASIDPSKEGGALVLAITGAITDAFLARTKYDLLVRSYFRASSSIAPVPGVEAEVLTKVMEMTPDVFTRLVASMMEGIWPQEYTIKRIQDFQKMLFDILAEGDPCKIFDFLGRESPLYTLRVNWDIIARLPKLIPIQDCPPPLRALLEAPADHAGAFLPWR